MPPETVYECATDKCANAIATEGLNRIQLEALRRWARTCERCKQRTIWQEKVLLLNTQINQKPMEGKTNASITKVTTKSQSQKRRAARHDGLH